MGKLIAAYRRISLSADVDGVESNDEGSNISDSRRVADCGDLLGSEIGGGDHVLSVSN